VVTGTADAPGPVAQPATPKDTGRAVAEVAVALDAKPWELTA
jgi:hypothetical protein